MRFWFASWFHRDKADYLEITAERRWMWVQTERSLVFAFCCLQLVWSGPRLTPQRAADLLRPHQFTLVVQRDGPLVASTGAPSVLDAPPMIFPPLFTGPHLFFPIRFPALRRR